MANEPLVMTLDDAIAKLSARSDLDGRGAKILAAAITLRDSRGCERTHALRLMCSGDWGVNLQEKIDGKWKDLSLPMIDAALSNAVCLAAAQWQPEPRGQTEQRGVPEHVTSEAAQHDAPNTGKGFQQRGVAEHASASSSNVAPPDGRSGTGNADQRAHARVDASSCETGPAKKARPGTADPMQAAGSSAAGTTNAGGKSAEPPAKKPRTLQ